MKFERDRSFDTEFENIQNLRWYPYVGQNFKSSEQKIMVFAHNIPTLAEDYDRRIKDFSSKSYWADCIEEYTYQPGFWTESFRSFTKGVVGLKTNYYANSTPEIINQIDSFINRISYINYIQDLVVGSGQSAVATVNQISLSKSINIQLLGLLKITHCICWGRYVFDYIINTEKVLLLNKKNIPKKGFSEALIRINGDHQIKLLKIHHPSMPGFGQFSDSTNTIFKNFLL